jgi:hypothetical protein
MRWRNLASGSRGQGICEEAVEAFHAALQERMRARVRPAGVAMTQNNLGNALRKLA